MTRPRSTRWASALAALAVAGTAGGACSLGSKQTLADRIVKATKQLQASGGATATLAVKVALVKSDKPLVPGPLRILPAELPPVAALLDLRHGNAVVGVKSDDPATASLVFIGSDLYQRIPPKEVVAGIKVPSSAASNLLPLLAANGTQLLSTQAAGELVTQPPAGLAVPTTTSTSTSTTSTTVKPSALRRAPRIPRQWIAFDYSKIKDHDDTKRAGSYALNPDVLVRLLSGVLTGSIKQRSADPAAGQGLVRYDANVSRDKADRRLSERDRKTLNKMFTANAISGRVFKARIWLDATGQLRRFSITMRQGLSSIDRADLTVTIDVGSAGTAVNVVRPDPKATAVVGTLGQLVSSVSGA